MVPRVTTPPGNTWRRATLDAQTRALAGRPGHGEQQYTDCGTVLNPDAVRGQVIGGICQGIGSALSE